MTGQPDEEDAVPALTGGVVDAVGVAGGAAAGGLHDVRQVADPPAVIYSDRLREYLARKGFDHVAVELLSPTGATADSTELYVRPIREPEAQRLLAIGWRSMPAPVGRILVGRGVEFEDSVELGLRSFLGLKDVTTSGFFAWKL